MKKQKILLIHNKYLNKGGEDLAVESEIEFLKKYYNVEVIYFYNNFSVLGIFTSIFLNKNPKSEKIILKKIKEFQPEIVYFHNTWFKVWNNIFYKIEKNYNLKILVKLHNYRFLCTNTFFTSKHLLGREMCPSCGGSKNSLKTFNKYYSNNYFKSFLVNFYGKRYFKILKNSNIKLVLLTNFQKNKLIQLGFKIEKLHIFYNPINLDQNIPRTRKDYFVYAGRLSSEKGLEELVNVFDNLSKNYQLLIIGAGPLYEKLKNNNFKNIKLLGELSHIETLEYIKNSKALISNTKLYEGQPTILCEASLLKVPSIFPNNGGISEFFPQNYNLLFDQGEVNSLYNLLNNIDSYDLEKISNENFKFMQVLLDFELQYERFCKLLL